MIVRAPKFKISISKTRQNPKIVNHHTVSARFVRVRFGIFDVVDFLISDITEWAEKIENARESPTINIQFRLIYVSPIRIERFNFKKKYICMLFVFSNEPTELNKIFSIFHLLFSANEYCDGKRRYSQCVGVIELNVLKIMNRFP